MEYAQLLGWFVKSSNFIVLFCANFILRSALIIITGLLLSYCMRHKGAAVQSSILKATLIAVMLCPFTKISDQSSGFGRYEIDLPQTAIQQSTINGISEPIDNIVEKSRELIFETPEKDETRKAYYLIDIHKDFQTGKGHACSASFGFITGGILTVIYCFISICWVLLTAGNIYKFCLNHLRMVGMIQKSKSPTPDIIDEFKTVSQQLGIKNPRIRISSGITSPILTGLLNPVILLPSFDRNQVFISREVVIHECAHLKRYDQIWNCLAGLYIVLVPFQPLLYVLSKQIERTSEYVCDDYVISMGSDRRIFAHKLVDIAEISQLYLGKNKLGIGIMSPRFSLDCRIRRILDRSRVLSVSTKKLTSIFIITGIVSVSLITGLLSFNAGEIYAHTEYLDKRDNVMPVESQVETTSTGNDNTVQQPLRQKNQVTEDKKTKSIDKQEITDGLESLNRLNFRNPATSTPDFSVKTLPEFQPVNLKETFTFESSIHDDDQIGGNLPNFMSKSERQQTNETVKESVTMYFSYVWGEQLQPPEGLGRYLVGLKEALLKWTDIHVEITKPVWLSSSRLHTMPFVFITTDQSFTLSGFEIENVRKYLMNGGFLVLENASPHMESSQAETSFKNMLHETLGSLVRIEPLPNDSFLYHCFFHFDDGPPLGSELQMYSLSSNTAVASMESKGVMAEQVQYLEGIWVHERLVGVYSNKGYANKWNEVGYMASSNTYTLSSVRKSSTRTTAVNTNNIPQLKMGVNFVVFALKSKGLVKNSYPE